MKTTANVEAVANESVLNVCCDVGMDELHLTCGAVGGMRFPRVFSIPNRTRPIRATLAELRKVAAGAGLSTVRVIVEPTGVYHKLLLRLAREAGLKTSLVNAEHVVKMRQVIFGDTGKTDRRDPEAIAAVAAQGRLVIDRQLPEAFERLRGWAKIYQDAEDGIIDAKNRIHRALKLLFPDFDFSTDFLYGPSGRAVLRCYGFNPPRLASLVASRAYERLRRRCRILRSSVARLIEQARLSSGSARAGAQSEIAEQSLRLAWEELELHERRREDARERLAQLYTAARLADPRLPAPLAGVVSITGLARLFAEIGPLGDFESWRQVLRLGGLNLCERQSGRYRGQTKISRKGRPQLRRILNQLALPLVRRRELFGPYYAQKTAVQKMPGKKAMTAVARKLVKMIWGWYHSETGFDRARVFRCEAAYRNAA